jgi:hypothetical protein
VWSGLVTYLTSGAGTAIGVIGAGGRRWRDQTECHFPTGTRPDPCTPAGNCPHRRGESCSTVWGQGRLTVGHSSPHPNSSPSLAPSQTLERTLLVPRHIFVFFNNAALSQGLYYIEYAAYLFQFIVSVIWENKVSAMAGLFNSSPVRSGAFCFFVLPDN